MNILSIWFSFHSYRITDIKIEAGGFGRIHLLNLDREESNKNESTRVIFGYHQYMKWQPRFTVSAHDIFEDV